MFKVLKLEITTNIIYMYKFSKLDEEDNAKIEKLYGILKSYIYKSCREFSKIHKLQIMPKINSEFIIFNLSSSL